ncbi:hypothetical protein QWJ90_01370 [Microbacterium oryzae]|nr:hypothetical protein [Microbacterium oryzae]
MSGGLTAFIISPIGNRLEPVGSPGRARYEESGQMWEEVFEPACKEFGLTPVRSDKITETGEIPDQIFTYLRDADVVIADLSHANPNVMYELGLRHSRAGKITIQVGEYGQLPFDVTTIRTIQFKRTEAGLVAARKELSEALKAALEGGGSALRATLVFNDAPSASPEKVRADASKSAAEDEGSVESDDPAVLDMLAEGEAAMHHIAEVLEEANVLISDVSAQTVISQEKMQQSDSKGKGFAGRLLIVKELAEAIEPTGIELEERANEFLADVRQLDAMIRYGIQRLQNGDEDIAEAGGFITSTLGLVDSAESGAVGIAKYQTSTKNLRKMSKLLDRPSKSLERGSGRLLEGIDIMSHWKAPLEELRSQLPDDRDGSAPTS